MIKKGFTLVELLVVMAILGILVAIVAGNFRSAQLRGRDAQRKSDLKQVAEALELFYADYGKYPAESSTKIASCAYNPATQTGSACDWGLEEMTDGKTIYFKTQPPDPSDDAYYRYRIVPGSSDQKFQLFARLENTQDQDLITTAYSCGSVGNCNFAVTSANTNATE
jgi:type II secretion system protein G